MASYSFLILCVWPEYGVPQRSNESIILDTAVPMRKLPTKTKTMVVISGGWGAHFKLALYSDRRITPVQHLEQFMIYLAHNKDRCAIASS